MHMRAWRWMCHHQFAFTRRHSLALAGGLALGFAGNSRAARAAPRLGLRLPRDHGAHLDSRIEWWYATGWLKAIDQPALLGFQVTFFRTRTGLAQDLQGRLAPRHLLFAHAALTDLQTSTHRHVDRMARWSGQDLPDLLTRASLDDTDVSVAGWRFRRTGSLEASLYTAKVSAAGMGLDLALQCAQPALLQGEAGVSRKGPEEAQYSLYTSQTQARATGSVRLGRRLIQVREGRAWIDHEWSDELLHPQAVGWDWIGVNLDDGRSLMAFQLRRADGSTLWAGGSMRAADGSARHFQPQDLVWTARRRWQSPATRAIYPVEWQVQTPLGTWRVRGLLDAQELDNRNSTGTVYWEGLAELLEPASQQRVGLGYLEMTGYAGRLRL